MQTRVKTSTVSPREMRIAIALAGVLFVSFVITTVSGIWLTTSWLGHNESIYAKLKVWHLVGGLVFIIAGLAHIRLNKWWYKKWLKVPPRDWYGVAQYRLMPIFTMLFLAVSITGPLIGFASLWGLVGFHEGCGFLLAIFALIHMAARFKSLRK